MDITDLQHGILVQGHDVDATANRERSRQRRLWKVVAVCTPPLAWFWYRELSGDAVSPGLPPFIHQNPALGILIVLFVLMGALAMLPYMGAGKSPHTLLRPSDSGIRLADVVGAEGTRLTYFTELPPTGWQIIRTSPLHTLSK